MSNINTLSKILIIVIISMITVVVNVCFDNSQSINIAVTDTCSIDGIVGSEGSMPQLILRQKTDFIFQGWFADAFNSRLPGAVSVELANMKGVIAFSVQGTTGIARDDVAKVFGNDLVKNAGFSIKSNTGRLLAGVYEIILVGIYDDQVVVCRTNRKIQIK